MAYFVRCEGWAGSVPQGFIDEKFPKCPMCGTTAPYWKLKDKMEIKATRTLFLCANCNAVISASKPDTMRFGKIQTMASLNVRAFNALTKKASGKDPNEIYMRIDEVGNVNRHQLTKDSEMTMTELQTLMD